MVELKEEIVTQPESSEEMVPVTEEVETAAPVEGAENEEAPVAAEEEAETQETGEPEKELGPEELKELEREGMALDKAADRHRAKRDELNAQTRQWVEVRDGLNAKVREYVDEASKHREARDEYNTLVQESKELRDECNKAVSELSDQLQELRKDLPPQEKGRPSIMQLKREFNHLEMKQQTTALKKKEEEALVKRMREIADQLAEFEKTDLQDGDYRAKLEELRDMKSKAEEHHRDVSKYADLAQAEHDLMIEFYGKADAVRKEADEAQAKFIESKKAADEEHRLHIAALQTMQKAENTVAAARGRQRDARKKQEQIEFKKEAGKIFERFKSGEKLSTDDLLTLQKSGYL